MIQYIYQIFYLLPRLSQCYIYYLQLTLMNYLSYKIGDVIKLYWFS